MESSTAVATAVTAVTVAAAVAVNDSADVVGAFLLLVGTGCC